MRVTPISSYNIELCTIFDVCNVFSCKSQFIQLQRNAVKAEFDLKEQMKMFISVKKRKWKCWYLVQMLNFDLVCFKPLSWTEALKMPPVKSVIPSNPKSKVWRHFCDSFDGKFAQCLICNCSKTTAIHRLMKSIILIRNYPFLTSNIPPKHKHSSLLPHVRPWMHISP